MKKILVLILFLIFCQPNANACQVIGVGNSNDNSDCAWVLNNIYQLKARVQSSEVDQKVYSTLWQDDSGGVPNVLFVIFGKMVNLDYSSQCNTTPTNQCLKRGAEECIKSGTHCSVEWDKFIKYSQNDEWTSGYAIGTIDYTQHLRQYGDYLIGYWAKKYSPARNYFVVDIKKNDLGILLSQ